MKRIFRLLILSVFVFAGSFLMFRMLRDGYVPLASFIGAAVLFTAVIFIRKELHPFRWMIASIIMALLFVVYPVLYTIYLSLTNMSSGHLLNQKQAAEYLLREKFTPENSPVYSWTAYKEGGGKYLLLIKDENENTLIVRQGSAPEKRTFVELPEEIDGYREVSAIDALKGIEKLSSIEFGKSPETVTVQSMDEAVVSFNRYSADEKSGGLKDNTDGVVYVPADGVFKSEAGKSLTPGYMVNTGLSNYSRFIGNSGYREPMAEIIIWNTAFAFFSVIFSFALGLAIAVVFEKLPGKRLIRALLILPYPIPVLVSIMVWRGLLNERMGLVTGVLQNLFGTAPHFFTDTFWTRIALIVINVYLSYPYFYILSSGALKSVSSDIYEAAEIDGAGPVSLLRHISLPIVLHILAPLLIASFSFNFNNFTLIWGFNTGLPALADSIIPMGHTDLLISFIYRLGFNMSNAADYGFSAAITVMLFLFVSVMVIVQMINTRALKESE